MVSMNIHPYQDNDTIQRALELFHQLQNDPADIFGGGKVTLQPVAGAQGEFTGLKIISAYHQFKNNKKTKIIIPDSAHGTNPASAVLAGYEVVEIKNPMKKV